MVSVIPCLVLSQSGSHLSLFFPFRGGLSFFRSCCADCYNKLLPGICCFISTRIYPINGFSDRNIFSFLFILYLDKTKTENISTQYVDEITPVPAPRPPPPKWKRSAFEWERDRIELAELDYGKHALRYKEVPPYFETTQGICDHLSVISSLSLVRFLVSNVPQFFPDILLN